jgi:hypothetical protein
MMKRVDWCHRHQNWAVKKCKTVVFSDESYLCETPFRIRWIRRYKGEQLGEDYCESRINTRN